MNKLNSTSFLNPGLPGIFFVSYKRFRVCFSFFLFTLLVTSCANQSRKEGVQPKPTDLIRYSNCLKIDSTSTGVKVCLIQPELSDTFKLFLSKTPKNMPSGYTFLKVPVSGLAVLSATQIGMLEKLSALSTVKGVGNERYIYSTRLKSKIKNGQTITVGQFDNISYERLIKSRSQAMLFSGFSGDFPQSTVLKKSGIQPIPIYDWKEQHPLGKAEWIKFMGYLVGKSHESIIYFNQLENRYNDLKNVYSKRKGPTVFCGNLTGDIWYAPAGESYQAKLLSDAGASYCYSSTKGIGSLSLSLEQVLKDNLVTDYWLNPGIPKLNQLKAIHPLIAQFTSCRNGNVFCYSRDMNKYWELAAIEPDKVLADFIQIFYESKKRKQKLYFYQKVMN